MNRSRGTRIALPSLIPLLALAAIVGCVPHAASPGASLSPTLQATPIATPRLPTPVPTIAPASVSPGTPSPPSSSAALLIRLTTCSDACGSVAGTTIMDDGQVIWQDENLRILEARLSPAGLTTVHERLDEVGALATDGQYQAKLRPGAEPVPRGTTGYRFELRDGGAPVVVTSGEPADFASEPELWIIPPEMEALAALAAQLNDPMAWLGVGGFAVAAQPYAPARYLVVIDLIAGVGAEGEFPADVDDVDWPFGNPIESVGEPIGPGEDGPPPRCLIVDARIAAATASVESAVGVERDLRQWSSGREYAWRRAEGFVVVSLLQLLPYETGPCAELVLSSP